MGEAFHWQFQNLLYVVSLWWGSWWSMVKPAFNDDLNHELLRSPTGRENVSLSRQAVAGGEIPDVLHVIPWFAFFLIGNSKWSQITSNYHQLQCKKQIKKPNESLWNKEHRKCGCPWWSAVPHWSCQRLYRSDANLQRYEARLPGMAELGNQSKGSLLDHMIHIFIINFGDRSKFHTSNIRTSVISLLISEKQSKIASWPSPQMRSFGFLWQFTLHLSAAPSVHWGLAALCDIPLGDLAAVHLGRVRYGKSSKRLKTTQNASGSQSVSLL